VQRQQQTDLLSAWEAAGAGIDARLPGGPVAGLEGGPVAGLDGGGGGPDIEVKLIMGKVIGRWLVIFIRADLPSHYSGISDVDITIEDFF